MEEFIQSAVNSFSEFLIKNRSKLKETRSLNPLVGFCINTGEIDLKDKIDYLVRYYERSFYLEKPDQNFLLLGVDEALSISENGDKRFAATDKKIKEIKNNFISNLDEISFKSLPIFLGGMKFNVEHSDDDWKDFTDSTWFVPELLIVKNRGENYLLYSFIFGLNSSEENLKEKFKKKLENLYKPGTGKNYNRIKINKLEGTSPKDKKKWKNLINACLDNILNNEVEKIVAARRIDLLLSEELNLDYVIKHLREKYPGCYLFIFHKGKSSFFGATPEKLARFDKGRVEIETLAGSAPRGNTEDEDKKIEMDLLNNDKDVNEHNIVVDYVKNSVSGFVNNLVINEKQSIKKLKNIQHIKTSISGELNSKNSPFVILKELFPTPAVCGLPKDISINLIKKLESCNRGLYAGIIGWLNLNDEGEFAIGIRSALTFGNKLIAYAGSGIVDKSDPNLEFEETELKLKPILSLFNEN